MKTAAPLKIFTILAFVIMIVGFIAFRSGVFTDEIAKNAKKPAELVAATGNISDTVPLTRRDSMLADTMLPLLSGSKSMMVIPKNHPAFRKKTDSLSKKNIRKNKRKKVIMESSKLGRIVPEDNSIIQTKDTTKEKQQKKQ